MYRYSLKGVGFAAAFAVSTFAAVYNNETEGDAALAGILSVVGSSSGLPSTVRVKRKEDDEYCAPDIDMFLKELRRCLTIKDKRRLMVCLSTLAVIYGNPDQDPRCQTNCDKDDKGPGCGKR
jgi:hypothetical protein